MDKKYLYFNGLDGTTGGYDLPPITSEELVNFITGEGEPENIDELRGRYRRKNKRIMGVKAGVNSKNLNETGWGIIFASDSDPQIEEALGPLIRLRQEQAGAYYKRYSGPEKVGGGVRPDESKDAFIIRNGVGPGPANPELMPYYLLIVGSPEKIPYRFQSQLDVQYAVGRIHFQTLDEYENYAHSVVAAETGGVKLPRQAAFFATANPDDPATEMSAKSLVEPLCAKFSATQTGWQFTSTLREDATKTQLANLLGGVNSPALLFAATHGMRFPAGHPCQLSQQGALVCQDWPGPDKWKAQGPLPRDFFFAGEDLDSRANLLGMMAFFFACFGAGTPQYDEFAQWDFKTRQESIANAPFLAQLPMKMLSNPGGAALAVVGHVERAWSFSFDWDEAGPQTTVFESSLNRLLDGYPVGAAFEDFNERYAELSTVLSDMLEDKSFQKKYDPYLLASLWTANNDARGYAILGDPAVRLPVDSEGPGQARPEVRPVEINTTPPTPAPTNPPVSDTTSTPIEKAIPITPIPVLTENSESNGQEAANPVAESQEPANGDSQATAVVPHSELPKATFSTIETSIPQPDQPVPEPTSPVLSEKEIQPMPTISKDNATKETSIPKERPNVVNFSPLPEVEPGYKEEHPEIYKAWVKHIEAGYKNNDEVFRRIMNAFMRSHQSTLIMYWLLFAVGIGFFATSIILALFRNAAIPAAIFGGLSVISFLTYFVSLPTRAVEENLLYITWLGIIYNSYWTHLAWSFKRETAQGDLNQATSDAISALQILINRHEKAVGKRPKLEEKDLLQPKQP